LGGSWSEARTYCSASALSAAEGASEHAAALRTPQRRTEVVSAKACLPPAAATARTSAELASAPIMAAARREMASAVGWLGGGSESSSEEETPRHAPMCGRKSAGTSPAATAAAIAPSECVAHSHASPEVSPARSASRPTIFLSG
jgi:hypothetical protein